jgi:hypothetical protein
MKLITGPDVVTGWALGTLGGWIREGDNAPQVLRYMAIDAAHRGDDATASHPTPPPDCAPAPRMRLVQAHLHF